MGVSVSKNCFQDCNSEAEIQTSSGKNFKPVVPSKQPPCWCRNHVHVNVRVKNRKMWGYSKNIFLYEALHPRGILGQKKAIENYTWQVTESIVWGACWMIQGTSESSMKITHKHLGHYCLVNNTGTLAFGVELKGLYWRVRCSLTRNAAYDCVLCGL